MTKLLFFLHKILFCTLLRFCDFNVECSKYIGSLNICFLNNKLIRYLTTVLVNTVGSHYEDFQYSNITWNMYFFNYYYFAFIVYSIMISLIFWYVTSDRKTENFYFLFTRCNVKFTTFYEELNSCIHIICISGYLTLPQNTFLI